ncbi:hypothetical protein D3C73_1634390 [compost metagenome]
MLSPFTVVSPELTLTMPKIAFSRVDLPAPFGPMMPISSPFRAIRFAPLRMFTPGR